MPEYPWFKRTFDILGALALLALLGPAMAVVWVLVRTRMGRPAIFRQQRAGRLGRPFLILKFRSMSQACDAQGRLLPDLQRLQPLGRFLRNSSLDELPQLWNVLRGDMSLVGPRPLLLEYVPRYSPEQRHRLDVRPGITGLAQVSGRNSLEWEDRMRLDLEYVGRLSLGLDLRILFRTVKRVLTAADVPADGVDPVQPPWTRAGPQATTDATGTEAAAIPSVSRDSRGAA